MPSHILQKFGFNKVSISDNDLYPIATKVENNPLEKNGISNINDGFIDVSVTHPQDHKHPQLVFKLTREILTHLKWEITDRVSFMANINDKTIILLKTHKKDKDSFAISTQGTTIAVAKKTKRGGIVKIGWREQLCNAVSFKGTFNSPMEIFDNAVIVKLPDNIFI